MASTYGTGGHSPTSFSRTLERVFEDAQHTGEINLNGRKLKEYPKFAAKYDLIDTIVADFSKNRLTEVPSEICEYTSMERLTCYNNAIRSIPEALVQLQSLTHLNLSRNQLSNIPPFISHLQALEVLIACNNRLVSLPEEIGQLERLMELDVSCNELSHLPAQIGDLISLKSLNLRRNFLVELPLDISKLILRKLDISSNKISCLPSAFRKNIDNIEDVILDHNPLVTPPAHICTKGKRHIKKFLQIEAIKEDWKRGVLNETDIKRISRKSLPQAIAADEFKTIDTPEARWKRHTVMSNDSGYNTTDSSDKCRWSPSEQVNSDMDEANCLALKAGEAVKEQRQGRELELQRRIAQESRNPPLVENFHNHTIMEEPPPSPLISENRRPVAFIENHDPEMTPESPSTPLSSEDAFTRELQRQKTEYDRRKKLAESIRMQQEEDDEREERRRAALRVQEEQRALLDRQRDDARQREDVRLREEARQQQDARQHDEARQQQDARQQEEARQREEARQMEDARQRDDARQMDDQQLHKLENKKLKPRRHTVDNCLSYSQHVYPYARYDYEGNIVSMSYNRKAPVSSQSFKDERKISMPTSQYRRTVSDTGKLRQKKIMAKPNFSQKNNVSDESFNSSGSSTPVPASPNTSLSSINSTPPSRSNVTSNGINHTPSDKSTSRTTTNTSTVIRRTRPGERPTAGRSTTPRTTMTSAGQGRVNNTVSTIRNNLQNKANNTSAEEDVKLRHSVSRNQNQRDVQPLKRRGDEADKSHIRQTPTSKRPGDDRIINKSSPFNSVSSLSNRSTRPGTRKMLDDSNPSFTMRRQHEQAKEEREQLERLRHTIEARLKVTLPDNLGDALRDGVVLCHLANQIRPRAVASIHVPSPAVPKLTLAKCRRNVENFLEACRKIGVGQEQICSAHDVLEEKGTTRAAITVAALVAMATNPKQSAV